MDYINSSYISMKKIADNNIIIEKWSLDLNKYLTKELILCRVAI